ncbi:hypothetical protein JMJ77_0000685 [Colletotrichum scovillei]|uniref:F-box domain-containing protein n=1 Tax=Colletotrichum scovillei TaxID=1209932 RepID=A0A9P7RA23_9PEZI|nr:hypothetical protein JMJ77_0000685 [Colletotrichum scovillei]KAG7071897.1 hypothetical protein JMJ76_0004763 [Colletotrichum scovillei]KAG7080143.1 hypothetical protein JMJ78_0007245 [Colletotrichum scovillei]
MSINQLPTETLLLIFGNLVDELSPFPGDVVKLLEYSQASSRDMGHYGKSVALKEHLDPVDPQSRKDILSLARVNSRFSHICAELLYRRIVVTDDKRLINSRKLQITLALSGAELQQRVIQLRIDRDRDCGVGGSVLPKLPLLDPSGLSHLRTLELSGDVGRYERLNSRSRAHWFRAIPKLPSLERLALRHMNNVVCDFVESHMPALRRITDLCLFNCRLATGGSYTQKDFFQCFPALRTLTIGDMWVIELTHDAQAFAPFADTLETFTWYEIEWQMTILSTSAYPLQAHGLRAVKHLKVASLLQLMCGDTNGCAARKTVETIELLNGSFDLRHVPQLLTKDGRWNGLVESALLPSWPLGMQYSTLKLEELISEEMERLLKFLFRQCRDVYKQVRVLDIRVIADDDDPDRTEEEKQFLRKLALDYARIFKEDLGIVLLQGLFG